MSGSQAVTVFVLDLCGFEVLDHILDMCIVESKEVNVCVYQVSCRHCVCSSTRLSYSSLLLFPRLFDLPASCEIFF